MWQLLGIVFVITGGLFFVFIALFGFIPYLILALIGNIALAPGFLIGAMMEGMTFFEALLLLLSADIVVLFYLPILVLKIGIHCITHGEPPYREDDGKPVFPKWLEFIVSFLGKIASMIGGDRY